MGRALAALLLLAAPLATQPAAAQEVRGIPLGGVIPEGMQEPVGSNIEGPHSLTLWTFEDGLSLSATRDAETGEVLYMEMWRTDNSAPMAAPIAGLTYGETTRAEIHARFGSEGFVFEDRGRFGVFGPVTAYFISYEFEGLDTIVSFVTVQPTDAASPETADASTLDSIILTQGSYANLFWGVNRGRLPGYAPIPDPFAAE